MSVRKNIVTLGMAAAAVTGLAFTTLAPAQADPALVGGAQAKPGASDIVIAGSDTIQLVDGVLANYYNTNLAGTGGKIVSYDACILPAGAYYPCEAPDGTKIAAGFAADTGTGANGESAQDRDFITLSDGSHLGRPNGSGQGLAVIGGQGKGQDNPLVAYARSSGALNDADASAGLVAYPFAVDELQMAVAPNSDAPASLTIADIAGIYNGTYKHWNDIPGNSAGSNHLIHAYYPQSGSGTLKFFLQQLAAQNNNKDSTTGNMDANDQTNVANASNTAWGPGGKGTGTAQIQEHDPSAIKGDPDALAPFSVARASLINGSSRVVKMLSGWTAERAVYNVARSKDLASTNANNAATAHDNPAYFAGSTLTNSLFGPEGFFCSEQAQPIIEAQGFLQMKRLADGGHCGNPITTSTGESNLAAYAVGTSTAKLKTTVGATAVRGVYGVAHRVSLQVHSQFAAGAVPSGTVTAKVAGRTLSGKIDPTGKATVSVPASLGAGTYAVAVSYSGDNSYAPATAKASLTVAKASASIRAKGPKKAKGKKTVIHVTGTAAATGKVTVTLGSRKLGSATFSAGRADVTIKTAKLKKGKNKLTVSFAGANYTAAAVKLTLKK